MRAIGIDSIAINIPQPIGASLREGESKFAFRTLLGVGVIADNYEKFKNDYSNAIANSFNKVSYLEKEKEVYCNYDFKTIVNTHKVSIHQLFLKEIAKYIDEVYIFSTVFLKKEKMFAYGEYAKENRLKLSHNDFNFDETLNRINSYFPLIGVWRNRDYLKKRVDVISVDGVNPIKFDGWAAINSLPLKILFEGDRCNPLISTADIMAGLISYRIYLHNKNAYNLEGKLGYNEEGFISVLPELKKKVYYLPITHQAVKYICPTSNINLNINNYLKHPIIFLFRKESKQISTEIIRKLPGFNAVYNLAYRLDGSVKFFDGKDDKGRISEGDYLVYLSSEAKQDLDVIRSVMGAKINILSFDEVKQIGRFK